MLALIFTVHSNRVSSLVTNLSQRIKVRAGGSEEGDELDEYFPPFLWVVRDFSLELKDKNGNSITEKEYLENSIELKAGASKQVQERNNVLMCLRNYFKQRYV